MEEFTTRLPLELLRTIASTCSLSDLHSLSRTCRRLHELCDDAIVLQRCFLNHAGDPTTNYVPDKEALRKLLSDRLASEDPKQVKIFWARLAAASCRLPLLIDELHTLLGPVYMDLTPSTSWPPPAPVPLPARNIVGVLSTLAVLGYPTVNNWTVTGSLAGLTVRMLDAEYWSTWEPATRVSLACQISFCLALGMLGRPWEEREMGIGARTMRAIDVVGDLVTRVFLRTRHGENKVLDETIYAFEGAEMISLLIIACLAPYISGRPMPNQKPKEDIPSLRAVPLLGPPDHGRHSPIPLPDGKQVTLQEQAEKKMADTARLTSTFGLAPSWPRWLRGSVEAAIDNITQSEWVGYTAPIAILHALDAPVRNIHFVAEQDEHNPDIVSLTAENCIDGDGAFLLRGSVTRKGQVTLSKHNARSETWEMGGLMTPLGFSGYCCPAGSAPTKYFWFYKKDWVLTQLIPYQGLSDPAWSSS